MGLPEQSQRLLQLLLGHPRLGQSGGLLVHQPLIDGLLEGRTAIEAPHLLHRPYGGQQQRPLVHHREDAVGELGGEPERRRGHGAGHEKEGEDETSTHSRW